MFLLLCGHFLGVLVCRPSLVSPLFFVGVDVIFV